MMDFMCVADLAIWAAFKFPWLKKGWPFTVAGDESLDDVGYASTGYTCHGKNSQGQKEAFTPLGTLISLLLRRLAWEEPSVRRIAGYFFASGIAGAGRGWSRRWADNIYSPEIREDVTSGRLMRWGSLWDPWTITSM